MELNTSATRKEGATAEIAPPPRVDDDLVFCRHCERRYNEGTNWTYCPHAARRAPTLEAGQ